MIILPEGGWPAASEDDAGGSLLTGAPAPLPLGTFRLPNDPHLIATAPSDDDPATRADAMRERAAQVFERHRVIGAFNRDLDGLFSNMGTDSSGGLGKFDREVRSLRQKHGAALRSAEDRATFERHADEFGAMQRIALKRTTPAKPPPRPTKCSAKSPSMRACARSRSSAKLATCFRKPPKSSRPSSLPASRGRTTSRLRFIRSIKP